MTNVIQFPLRPAKSDPLCVEVLTSPEVTLTVACSGWMHYFTDRDKPCGCGQARWPDERAS